MLVDTKSKERHSFHSPPQRVKIPPFSCVPCRVTWVGGGVGGVASSSAEAISQSFRLSLKFPSAVIPVARLHLAVGICLLDTSDAVRVERKTADHHGGSSGWSLETCHPQRPRQSPWASHRISPDSHPPLFQTPHGRRLFDLDFGANQKPS